MELRVSRSRQELGRAAAAEIAARLNAAIAQRGEARVVLSTGMSQFETLDALVEQDVPWEKVTMFHLDEYVGLARTHKASFRRYLEERFVSRVPLGRAVYVDGEGDPAETLAALEQAVREAPVDVGVIGVGENAHIAFNDPPADFASRAAFAVVELSGRCRRQQVGEGWFASEDEVPRHAISMTPYQIMQCACIVSPVPRAVKADAVRRMLSAERPDPAVPASLLRAHPCFLLFLDPDSASLCSHALLTSSETLACPFEDVRLAPSGGPERTAAV